MTQLDVRGAARVPRGGRLLATSGGDGEGFIDRDGSPRNETSCGGFCCGDSSVGFGNAAGSGPSHVESMQGQLSSSSPRSYLSIWAQRQLGDLLKSGNGRDSSDKVGAEKEQDEQGEVYDEYEQAQDRSDGIAEALSQLSFQEREEVYNDLHGIKKKYTSDDEMYDNDGGTVNREEEDPAVVQASLDELEKHLKSMTSTTQWNDTNSRTSSHPENASVSAYLEALKQNETYVRNDAFRLGFLRAEEFDPQKAATRMVRFFEEKLALFPSDKLTKDIRMDDLDEGDLNYLKCGVFQLVPLKDRSGRHIIMTLPKLKPPKDQRTDKNSLRALYYMHMALFHQNEEAQRDGIVELFYKVGFPEQTDPALIKKKEKLRGTLPIRMAGGHVCTDDALLKILMSLVKPFMSVHRRSRSRMHFGGHLEVQYELLSFGIPLAALPVDDFGNYSNQYHKIWMENRHFSEMESAARKPQVSSSIEAVARLSIPPVAATGCETKRPGSHSGSAWIHDGTILQPNETDCILGRGKSNDLHWGNVLFRDHIHQPEVWQAYRDRPRFLKNQIAKPIQEALHEKYNLRFLKEHPSGRGWVVADEKTIHEKILRTCRRAMLKNDGAKKGRKQKKNENVH